MHRAESGRAFGKAGAIVRFPIGAIRALSTKDKTSGAASTVGLQCDHADSHPNMQSGVPDPPRVDHEAENLTPSAVDDTAPPIGVM